MFVKNKIKNKKSSTFSPNQKQPTPPLPLTTSLQLPQARQRRALLRLRRLRRLRRRRPLLSYSLRRPPPVDCRSARCGIGPTWSGAQEDGRGADPGLAGGVMGAAVPGGRPVCRSEDGGEGLRLEMVRGRILGSPAAARGCF